MPSRDIEKGRWRDQSIHQFVAVCHYVRADQVAELFFDGIKTGQRKAQHRLKRLVERGFVKRKRPDLHLPYVYYIGKWSVKWEHWAEVAQLYLRLRKSRKLKFFDTEVEFPNGQADAFFQVEAGGRLLQAFVEVYRGSFRNGDAYAAMYESGVFPSYVSKETVPVLLVVSKRGNIKVPDGAPVQQATFDDDPLLAIQRGYRKWEL